MKKFKIVHMLGNSCYEFNENTAPDWLTSVDTVEGSTMDDRWFWKQHVLQLDIGESVETDFHTITRIE